MLPSSAFHRSVGLLLTHVGIKLVSARSRLLGRWLLHHEPLIDIVAEVNRALQKNSILESGCKHIEGLETTPKMLSLFKPNLRFVGELAGSIPDAGRIATDRRGKSSLPGCRVSRLPALYS